MNDLIELVLRAGKIVMEIYERNFSVEYKDDKSPVTEADKRSHEIIIEGLQRISPSIPVVSEEGSSKHVSDKTFWLVDPLDGTKEFIKKNGEFTINVAFIENSEPILGIVYAPALSKLYFSQKGNGAYLINKKNGEKIKLPYVTEKDDIIRVVVSRSHSDKNTEEILKRFAKKGPIEAVSVGSSLKFCLLAEGKADVYPRTGPTMEWDTAAAHAILKEAGGLVLDTICEKELIYGKEGYINPPFIAFRNREIRDILCR